MATAANVTAAVTVRSANAGHRPPSMSASRNAATGSSRLSALAGTDPDVHAEVFGVRPSHPTMAMPTIRSQAPSTAICAGVKRIRQIRNGASTAVRP